MINYTFNDSTERTAARFLTTDTGKTAFEVDTGTFWEITAINGTTHLATWTQTGSYGGGGGSISLTTTGTSGAATLVGSTLNVPHYQGVISLTTTGSSGSATFGSDTLNIPTYTLSGLGGIGLTDLSASSPLSYNNTTGAFTIQNATTSQSGALTSTDWNTFNNKQGAISLTTTGTSGAATFDGSTLNIPQYTAGGGGAVSSLTTTGTSGAATLSSGVLNIPQYQGALTLTTTGSSGAATLVSNTLNIPQYTGGGGFSNVEQILSLTNTPESNPASTVTVNLSSFKAGDQIRIVAWGSAANATGATRTLQFNAAGSLSITDGATVANGGTVTYYMEAILPISDGSTNRAAFLKANRTGIANSQIAAFNNLIQKASIPNITTSTTSITFQVTTTAGDASMSYARDYLCISVLPS